MRGLSVLFILCPCVHPLLFYCALRAYARSLTLLHHITVFDTLHYITIVDTLHYITIVDTFSNALLDLFHVF